MGKLIFNPWMGKNYENQEKKFLILGDSSYCGECPYCGVRGRKNENDSNLCTGCENLIKKTIEEFLKYREGDKSSYKPYMQTYKRFERLFLGKQDVSPESSLELWNNITFINFVQTSAANTSNQKEYTEEDYELSLPLIWNFILKNRPNYIIVWGTRAYEHLPSHGWKEGIDEYEGQYTLEDGHTIKVLMIHHPRNFGKDNEEFWMKRIDTFSNK